MINILSKLSCVLIVFLNLIFGQNSFVNQIENDLNTKLDLEKNEYKLTGVLILFNNLLQSLFKSQILTLGIVILGIFIMFQFQKEKVFLIQKITHIIEVRSLFKQ